MHIFTDKDTSRLRQDHNPSSHLKTRPYLEDFHQNKGTVQSSPGPGPTKFLTCTFLLDAADPRKKNPDSQSKPNKKLNLEVFSQEDPVLRNFGLRCSTRISQSAALIQLLRTRESSAPCLCRLRVSSTGMSSSTNFLTVSLRHPVEVESYIQYRASYTNDRESCQRCLSESAKERTQARIHDEK